MNTILCTHKDTIYLTGDAVNALCLTLLLGFHVGLVVNAYIGGLGEINKVEMVDVCEVLFLHLETADHGQMVAEATLVECAEVGAVGLHVAVGGIFFHEEG